MHEESEFDEQDLDNVKENLKIENLTCDYYHNLVTNSQIDHLIEKYLNESLQKKLLNKEITNSLFYTACFWGFRDIVKQLFELYPSLDLNYRVPSTNWTPLHAATFCEHGPIVMFLLQKGSDLLAKDKYARTPLDFASVSDIVWPLFVSFKHERVCKSVLVEKSVYSRRQIQARLQGGYSTSDSIKLAPYQILRKQYRDDSTESNAAYANGDVLANENRQHESQHQQHVNFNLWK